MAESLESGLWCEHGIAQNSWHETGSTSTMSGSDSSDASKATLKAHVKFLFIGASTICRIWERLVFNHLGNRRFTDVSVDRRVLQPCSSSCWCSSSRWLDYLDIVGVRTKWSRSDFSKVRKRPRPASPHFTAVVVALTPISSLNRPLFGLSCLQ